MRFALLGIDSVTLALAKAIQSRSGDTLAWAVEADVAEPAALAALGEIAPNCKLAQHWESLLDRELVEAVIVSRSANEELRTDQLRKLVQVGMPVLVAHPAFESMLVYYELDMIRRDTNCPMMPLVSDRLHPAMVALRSILRGDGAMSIGKIEQVVMERHMAVRNKQTVLTQFARDVDVLRFLLGELTRLGAMAASNEESAYGHLGIQLSGERKIVARWAVSPLESVAGARIPLLGESGKTLLQMPDGDQPWVLETTQGTQTRREEFADWNPAAATLEQFHRAIDQREFEPNWNDAARGVELTETIARSLRRARTVELYYEDYTEEGTFKGTMSSVGCGLLLLGLAFVFIVPLAHQVGLPFLSIWPQLLLILLAGFLMVQLLKALLMKPPSDSRGGRPAEAIDDESDDHDR